MGELEESPLDAVSPLVLRVWDKSAQGRCCLIALSQGLQCAPLELLLLLLVFVWLSSGSVSRRPSCWATRFAGPLPRRCSQLGAPLRL